MAVNERLSQADLVKQLLDWADGGGSVCNDGKEIAGLMRQAAEMIVALAASAVCVRNAETQRMDEAMAAQMSKWIKVGAEEAHAEADRLLEQFLESLGYTMLVNAYNQVDKWYS